MTVSLKWTAGFLFASLLLCPSLPTWAAQPESTEDVLKELKKLVTVTSGNIDIQRYYDLSQPTAQSLDSETSIETYLARLPIVIDARTGETVPLLVSDPIPLTADDRYWLEKLVEAEAANEPFEGKVAVAVTLANRMANDEFPNTIMEVMTQKRSDATSYQYSPWDDGSIYWRVASQDTIDAVEMVFDEGIRNLPADTIYFYDYRSAPNSWQALTRDYIATIEHHVFSSTYSKGTREANLSTES